MSLCRPVIPVGCLAWSSAARHIGCRDRFIGWSADSRRKHIHLIAYNTRFLILPWVRVPYLASHIPAQMAKAVAADWQRVCNHFILTLSYIISPVDLIPDWILGFGQLDDIGILGLSLFWLEKDLLKYKDWKGRINQL